MRLVELRNFTMALGLTMASVAAAETPVAADAPVAPAVHELKPRSARLLVEGVTVGVAGLAVPMASYLGLTLGLQSFVGFFAGFASATLIGAIVAPIAVILAGRLMGAEGGIGRSIAGAAIGLAVGLLIGLPLATVPGAGYLVGLALAWLMPSVGTMIAFEWGRADPAATGLVVARF